MDNIRDTGKSDDFSRFIDAQLVRTDPFGRNRAAERLYRRAERLCAALYLLTRHIGTNEPVRTEVRSQALALLEKVLNLRNEMRVAESDALLSFESSVRRLISLVRVLTAAGFLSFQNADIVIAALDELGVFVSSAQRSALSEGVSLTREDIMGDTSPLIDRQFLKDIKDRRPVKDKTGVTDVQESASSRSAGLARAEGIVSILRSGGALGIKDITARLPDYSEKMIQRELAVLVKEGKVKKDGFKRWSKYSLVQ